jgi:hypothetical protein
MPHSREEVRAALDANLEWLERLPGVTAVSMDQSNSPKIKIYHSALTAETWNQIVERLGDMVQRGPTMEQHRPQ